MQTALEIRADKSKYKIMSRDQNAEQNHKIKTGAECCALHSAIPKHTN
jgi:hypothetical protein